MGATHNTVASTRQETTKQQFTWVLSVAFTKMEKQLITAKVYIQNRSLLKIKMINISNWVSFIKVMLFYKLNIFLRQMHYCAEETVSQLMLHVGMLAPFKTQAPQKHSSSKLSWINLQHSLKSWGLVTWDGPTYSYSIAIKKNQTRPLRRLCSKWYSMMQYTTSLTS